MLIFLNWLLITTDVCLYTDTRLQQKSIVWLYIISI